MLLNKLFYLKGLNINKHFCLADLASHTSGQSSHQKKAGVYKAERSRAANTSAAVDHNRAVLWTQTARLTHFEQEVEKRCRRLWHTKIRPCGVVELKNLPRFLCL